MDRTVRASLLRVAVACVLLACLHAPPPVAAATEPVPAEVTARVEQYVQAEVDALGLPGAAVTVVDGSGASWSAAFGHAGPGRPMTARTPVLLASTSKAITATVLLQLVGEGALDLDAPVVERLPGFHVPGPAGDPAASSRITARHLLAHTSGIPRTADVGVLLRGDGAGDADADADGTEPAPLARRVRDLRDVRLAAAPGQEFAYTNSNYDVLGLLAQEVSGRPFGELVRERVLQPLGMADSYASAAAADREGAAVGYYPWFSRIWRPTAMPRPPHSAPSVTMSSSSEDLGRLLTAHLATDPGLAAPAAWEELRGRFAPVTPTMSYGAGWYVRPLWEATDDALPGTPEDAAGLPLVWEHPGTFSTSFSFMAFVPERDVGVALVLNGNDQARQSRYFGVGRNLLRILAGGEPLAVTVTDDPLRRYGWALTGLLLVAELVSLAWSLRLLRRWGRASPPASRRRVAVLVGAPLLLDALVVWLAFVHVPRQFVTSVAELVRLSPDLGVLLVPLLAVTLVWAPARTVLLLRGSRRRAPVPAA